jgi:hypothetical protein
MRRNLIAIGVLFVTGLAMFQAPAYACSCRPGTTPEAVRRQMASLTLIFWGQAISRKVVGRTAIYTFQVAVPKGVLPVRIKVRTPASSATCGARFPLNKTVLVGAWRRGGTYGVGSCTQYSLYRNRVLVEKLLRACTPFKPCPGK